MKFSLDKQCGQITMQGSLEQGWTILVRMHTRMCQNGDKHGKISQNTRNIYVIFLHATLNFILEYFFSFQKKKQHAVYSTQ